MERKDRLFDWSIGILFVAIVAYAELLSNGKPSIWRVYLLVGLSCFIMRMFTNSCLAYAFLKKWRYLLDFIEKHWMDGETSIGDVKKEIKKYHYESKTTEKRSYFIKHQLIGGFVLLFVVPFVLIFFEYKTNMPQDLAGFFPLLILICYYVYEILIMCSNRHRSMPSEATDSSVTTETEQNTKDGKIKRLNGLFEIALVLLGILSAAEFQYFLTVEEESLYFYALKVFTVPFIVLIIVWLVKELLTDELDPKHKRLFTEFCWDFWSFTLFYYLLALYSSAFGLGIVLSFVLSMLLVGTITWVYSKASPVESGDRSMYDYYKTKKWIVIRYVVVFFGAYLFLLGIVLLGIPS